MRKILLDVNVVLDVLLDRHPHVVASAALWAAVEGKRVDGLVPAHGVTAVFYLVERHRDVKTARRVVGDLISVFGVAPVTDDVLRRALTLSWHDFEDAVCASAAEMAGCDAIVTRDPRGFPDSSVPILDPTAAMALLGEKGTDRVSERSSRYESARHHATALAGRSPQKARKATRARSAR